MLSPLFLPLVVAWIVLGQPVQKRFTGVKAGDDVESVLASLRSLDASDTVIERSQRGIGKRGILFLGHEWSVDVLIEDEIGATSVHWRTELRPGGLESICAQLEAEIDVPVIPDSIRARAYGYSPKFGCDLMLIDSSLSITLREPTEASLRARLRVQQKLRPQKQLYGAIVKCDEAGVIKALADDPALLNSREKMYSTPLHAAASHCPQVIPLLVKLGADMYEKNSVGEDPFMSSLIFPSVLTAKAFFASGYQLDPADVPMVLGRAASANNLAFYQFFTERGFSPAQIGRDGQNALHAAAWKLTGSWVERLARDGAQLHVIDSGMGGMSMRYTPFFHACHRSEPDAIDAFLKLGASPTETNDDGRTPLHVAMMNERSAEIVKILLQAGANPNATDIDGSTPLDYAARFTRDTATVGLLLRSGASPNPRPAGWSPLLGAAFEGRVDLVKLLIAHGADTTMQTEKGESYSVILRKALSRR